MNDQSAFPPFPEWPEPAVAGLVDVTDGPIYFTPVPRRRPRHDGWTAERQKRLVTANIREHSRS